jgi:hypothetical protein
MVKYPIAFLCHSSVDNSLTEQLAMDLRKQGVNAWFDKWEIIPGDSLRRKIDEGIEDAGFFIAILSSSSLKSEWVQSELDAGMVKRIEGSCRLIVCPYGINDEDIPVTLRGRRYVRLTDYESGLRELVNTCHGLSEKPPLGDLPTQAVLVSGLSPIASRIASHINEQSEEGIGYHKVFNISEMADTLSLTDEEVEDAVVELEGYLLLEPNLNTSPQVMVKNQFFWLTDSDVKGWNPVDDAVILATVLQNDPEDSLHLEVMATKLDWSPRRANPAATYLVDNEIVLSCECSGTRPYAYDWMTKTSATRLFVKQNAR